MKKSLFTGIFFTVFISIFSTVVSAQQRTIDGVVTTLDDIRVADADVKIVRTKEVVKTDSLGVFKLSCLPGDKIRISAMGFSTQSFKVKENTTTAFVNLELKKSQHSREQAVAYGHVRGEENTMAITSVNLNERNYADFYDMFEVISQFPNVRVSGSDIIIRGTTSVNGEVPALIVIDQVIQPFRALEFLAPQNVKSVSILKGVSASAYGARGAGGAVLITTKKGAD